MTRELAFVLAASFSTRLRASLPERGRWSKKPQDPRFHSPITPQMMRSPAFPAGSLV
jgi:hypothetical protein